MSQDDHRREFQAPEDRLETMRWQALKTGLETRSKPEDEAETNTWELAKRPPPDKDDDR
jgi:hypothetical protein